jgi:CheY-like chemotaxis protein
VGAVATRRLGRVEQSDVGLPWHVIFPEVEHVAASAYLRELAASDCSPATPRSYAYAMFRWFRWFRFLHAQLTAWDWAERVDVRTFVEHLPDAPNPQCAAGPSGRRQARSTREPGYQCPTRTTPHGRSTTSSASGSGSTSTPSRALLRGDPWGSGAGGRARCWWSRAGVYRRRLRASSVSGDLGVGGLHRRELGRHDRADAIVMSVRRCLIVDDNERFLAVARNRLSREGLDVVGTATSQAEALRQADALRPDVVLVDISLGSESGFEVTRRLVEGVPKLERRVVLISTRDEDDYLDLIAASPAVGFIPKSLLSARAIGNLLSANGF